jgi:hypothetical protein
VKAQPLIDNSPEGRQRRARAASARNAAAFWCFVEERSKERERDLRAMSPSARILAQAEDGRECAAYERTYRVLTECATEAELHHRLENDPEFVRRLELAEAEGVEGLLLRLVNEEKTRAGSRMRPLSPKDEYSERVPRHVLHAAVRSCYPKHTKNPSRWWKQHIEGRVRIRKEDGKGVEVNLSQLRARFPNLTDEALSPLRRAS